MVNTAIGIEVAPMVVDEEPGWSGPDRARLADSRIEVWALIAHLQVVTGDDVRDPVSPAGIATVAADYKIPEAAVRAAIAYYHGHRAAIDGRFARNAAALA